MRARARAPGTALEPARQLVLDRYRLIRRLGEGGFGTVWMAIDERLDREVAIKILPRARVRSGRFEREARAAARLSHPGIVTLYEATVDDRDAYLVSELVLGETLQALLEKGRLSDRDVAQVGVALCDALIHAHAQGVIHRDVKPSNVLIPVRSATSGQLAKLTDFGIARLLGGDALTRTGDVVGTAAYMAPEQAEGLPAGPAADLYSLALVIYEALTGVNPVRITTAALRARRLGAHLPPLRRQRRELPATLASAVDLSLRPRARERGSLEELRNALAQAAPLLTDRCGVVAPSWGWRAGRMPQDAVREPTPDPEPPALHFQRPLFEAEPEAVSWAARHWRTRVSPPTRLPSAAAAALVGAWIAGQVLPHSYLPPPVVALVCALIVGALPRVGWIAATTAATAALGLSGRPGAALIVLLAAGVPMLALLRSGVLWPLGAVGPALGVIGLAGSWPALAGLARTAWQRAGLALTGWAWILLATPLSGQTLYVRRPSVLPAVDVWTSSLAETADHVLSTLITPASLAVGGVWALAAAILPLIVRGRIVALDVVIATVWTAAVASATASLLTVQHHRGALTPLHGAVMGAVCAGFVAVLSALARHRRIVPRAADSEDGLP